MTGNNSTKLQHYVPACYLANFAINKNENRDTKVYYYNIETHKSGVSKVGKFPAEKYFYDVDELGENKRIIEELYINIEGELSTQIKNLLQIVIVNPNCRKHRMVNLNKKDKDMLSALIALQITRTQEFRNRYKSINEQLIADFPFADIPELTKPDIKRIHTTEILSFDLSSFYANLFDDRNWVFIVNHTDIPFITSDNPAIMLNYSRNPTDSLSPVSDKSTFFFPISPTIAIEIFHKNIAEKDLMYFDIYNRDAIRWYNRKIVEQCTRLLFANKPFTNGDKKNEQA